MSRLSSASAAAASTASPSSSSSSTVPPPAAPSVFLSLSERSFAHLHLSSHTFLHVYVGRVGPRLMVLPLHLHLHPSLLTASPPSILGRLFHHLPSLIADVHLTKATKLDRPHLLTTDEVLFSYAFKQTHPAYHVLTLVDPTKARESHPMVDSEEEEEEEGEGEGMGDDEDEEDLGDASEDEEGEGEEEEGAEGHYKGGKYRAFHVSQHSLYVRAVARHEGGVREEEEAEVAVRQSSQAAKPSACTERRDSPAEKGQAARRRSESEQPQQPPSAVRKEAAVHISDDDDFLF